MTRIMLFLGSSFHAIASLYARSVFDAMPWTLWLSFFLSTSQCSSSYELRAVRRKMIAIFTVWIAFSPRIPHNLVKYRLPVCQICCVFTIYLCCSSFSSHDSRSEQYTACCPMSVLRFEMNGATVFDRKVTTCNIYRCGRIGAAQRICDLNMFTCLNRTTTDGRLPAP